MVRKARPSWIEPLCLLAVVFYLLQLPQWLIFVRSINSVKTISFSLQFISLIESHPELWCDFLAKDHIFVRKSCIEKGANQYVRLLLSKISSCSLRSFIPDFLPFSKLKFQALIPQEAPFLWNWKYDFWNPCNFFILIKIFVLGAL